MFATWYLIVRTAALGVSLLAAQDAGTRTPGATAAPVSEPAPTPGRNPKLTGASSVDDGLDALHAVGIGLNDFTADVKLTESDAVSGAGTTRNGVVHYQKKPNNDARIRVVFTSKTSGGTTTKERTEYMLDNGQLTDRDYERQVEVVRQVLKPGQKIDLFKLGEGPFPLPIGQPREDVYKQFDVTKVTKISKSDPADTLHLRLKPKEGTDLARKFSSIDVWVDTKTNFPKRIETLDENQSMIRSTDLEVTAKNSGIGDAEFTLPQVTGTWNRHRDEYDGR